ncbi:PilW family protein [Vibrio alginolyticus]|uniref:PilW family protein n=1 Tax=Vibrio sp. B1FLJ16 TaxID=2751178 RepID=UPI0015F6E712|nr:pilus assembly protein PilW [Vibrio sp. B1FLJ16]CAD7800483.1 General secretion pathway protein [Vibrio sp. B1FLJ16]CAE6887834.1 General secretion pathway protein [Vibrio sp. B1FLJ16]
MAIQNVRTRQRGGSLVELLIASLLGLIALGIVGNVFISGKRTAAERGKELLLLQNMTSVMQQMKEDMLRAGFNGISSGSVTLSGASYAIYSQTSPDMLGFVYRVTSAGVNTYRSVVYKHQPQSGAADLLQLCEKSSPTPLTPASAADSGYLGVCFNVFDPTQITVDSFTVSMVNTTNNSISSAFSVVSMGASLFNDPNVNHIMAIKAQQRNW